MAKRKRAIPQYGTVTLNGIDYYRTRVQNADGKLVALYARTPEELYDKELGALEQIDNDTFCRKSPTVADYCEKWLLMQSVHVRATTLIDYTSKVRRHIIKELGQMRMADVTLDDLDAIGVTYGPGLVGALLVGVAEAKAIAYAKKLPLVGVHHIEGHVSANYIEHPDLEPPFLCLIVSGGHTHLVIVKDYGEFEILGRTRDDAAGEAFDKVARAIGLGYPGGPKIDKLSKEGNPEAIVFPRAKIGDCPYDFSFSGVKSAVLNYINQAQMKGEEVNRADLAASFQKAVVDVLVEHTMLAAGDYKMTKIAIAGGVASNGALRSAMEKACAERGYTFYRPSPIFCTDNAAMIGVAAYYEYMKGTRHGWDLNAVPNLKLGER